ncbi:MAG: fibronectin type III domain-containing protein [Bdellovibrionota bacterium]
MNRLALLFCFLLAGCPAGSGSDSGSAPAGSTSASSGPKVQLNWTQSTGTPAGYYIEQSTDGINFSQVATASGTSTLISGLSSGTTYYFRIRAYNAGGTSAYTTIVSAVP